MVQYMQYSEYCTDSLIFDICPVGASRYFVFLPKCSNNQKETAG